MSASHFFRRASQRKPVKPFPTAVALLIASSSAVAAGDMSQMDGMPGMKGMGNVDMSDEGTNSSQSRSGSALQTGGAPRAKGTSGMDRGDQTKSPGDQPHPKSAASTDSNGSKSSGDAGIRVDNSKSPKAGPLNGPNHIIGVDEPRIPMANPNEGIPMQGMDMSDSGIYHQILINQLEYVKAVGGQGWSWDGEAWIGGDINRLWLKSSGERLYGKTDDARVEALVSHAYSTYWNAQLGVRHDFGNGPTRDWAAIGVEGLAPYFFNIQATGYIGTSGRTALQLKTSYDILLSQKLFLTPEAEMNAYGKSDPEREIGSGISDIKLGLRLRYEIRREIAPYIGFVWGRRFGRTADFSRRDGEPVTDTELVVGLRLWY
ncbi:MULTISPECIES: copper resistance protein B [Caballeronia]|uniref:Copper resistance protein CopB n=1 Tax=Caballeronia zhejiangensis TaxID=871203 RepID=A0A656QH69_9BURK|nr:MULTISPECIES: copper resistance protein B [Caballeronia]KDR28425.1 copper resistance protein CopB [Caballeronia zhejiangensis]